MRCFQVKPDDFSGQTVAHLLYKLKVALKILLIRTSPSLPPSTFSLPPLSFDNSSTRSCS